MNQIADSVEPEGLVRDTDSALESRIFRTMIVVTIAAVIVSAALTPWRFTTGLMLGGGLSLLNHHWLKTSLNAVFSTAESGKRVKIGAARYVLRYFVIAAVVASAYTLNLVSIVATLVGLCSFVVAAMIEAFMQIYFAIRNREET